MMVVATVVVVMMITMTKALDRLRWTLMDNRGQADETYPKWYLKCAPRQDKEREGAGREATNDAIVLAACLRCPRACLGACTPSCPPLSSVDLDE